MSQFQIHTLDSAPPESAAPLKTLSDALGFTPNLAATMAGSPALIGGFMDLRARLATEVLTGVEREIVALATSRENGCDYCMAVHSTFALMQDADPADVAGARDGDGPPDPKLAALYRFTQALVASNGHVDDHEIDELVDAGYPREAVLTVIAQVGFTTLANLAYGVSGVPIDGPFAPQAWQPA
jgi:uncharacterized peroxidase-related enzyme